MLHANDSIPPARTHACLAYLPSISAFEPSELACRQHVHSASQEQAACCWQDQFSICPSSGSLLCSYAAPLYVDVTKTTISAAAEDLGEPEQAETEEYSKIFIGEVRASDPC